MTDTLSFADLPPPYLEAMTRTAPHFLTPLLGQVERMAAQGMRPDQIAHRLGCSAQSFRDAIELFDDVALAVSGGAARLIDEKSYVVSMAADRGDISAAMFLLRTRCGYTTAADRGETRVPSPQVDAPASVTLEHVSAMAAQQRAIG